VTARAFRILIVDDEPNIRAGLARGLAHATYEVETSADADEALAAFERMPAHLVITDLKMPGALSGLDLIHRIKQSRPETLISVITAHGSIETAVEAMRLGAHDYVPKPVDLNLLRLQVRKAYELHCLNEENRELRLRLAAHGDFPELIGQSPAMASLIARLRQVADTDVTVLIQGESGSGKELVARAIHRLGDRHGGPFVAVNIGALPETLSESELFGFERGAFSGAHRQKAGWFEMAQRGTLFLDEVGEMLPKTQVDLLRVLEQREVRRLGGERVVPVNVRLVVATHQDVDELVAKGRLREDLYYRLNVVPLRVPPLRERRTDVPLLVEHFLEWARLRHRQGEEPKKVAGEAMTILCDYSWPGNVRQLRNLMERLAVTVEAPVIHADNIPAEMRSWTHVPNQGGGTWPPSLNDGPPRRVVTLDAAIAEAEKAAILAALAECNHHRERAAQALGISVRTLHYKLNRYMI
jgi:two-component system, NtrC family, response regulator AtoC